MFCGHLCITVVKIHVNFDSYVVLFLTLCEGKVANSPVFSLEIGEFQNITVLVTKAKFERNNSHFLYFLDISNQKITLTTQEQKSCYIV
jgi:hypothetical protein